MQPSDNSNCKELSMTETCTPALNVSQTISINTVSDQEIYINKPAVPLSGTERDKHSFLPRSLRNINVHCDRHSKY